MRLFIALDFNGLEDYFIELQNKIPDSEAIRKVTTFHLTLKFLGEVEDNKLDLIKEKLAKVNFQQFSLTLDKIGVFPNENHIKVIWAGITPKEQITLLQKNIEDSLKEFNFKKDYNFHPHITLTRVKFVKSHFPPVCFTGGYGVNQIKVENEGPENRPEPVGRACHRFMACGGRFSLDNKEELLKTIKEIQVQQKTIKVSNFKLIKSTLKLDGPVYEDIAVFS